MVNNWLLIGKASTFSLDMWSSSSNTLVSRDMQYKEQSNTNRWISEGRDNRNEYGYLFVCFIWTQCASSLSCPNRSRSGKSQSSYQLYIYVYISLNISVEVGIPSSKQSVVANLETQNQRGCSHKQYW